jgi:hypothetical protein
MNPRLLSALLVSLSLLARPALARPASWNELSLGATTFSYLSYQRPSVGFMALEAAYHRRAASAGPWSALRFGGGLRTGMATDDAHFPLEGFLQVQLSARVGIWEAVVGPELGLSGFAKLVTPVLLPLQEARALEDERFGPVYVAFTAAPVRLHFGRVVASALELQLGTNMPSPGSAIRMQLSLLRVGVEL